MIYVRPQGRSPCGSDDYLSLSWDFFLCFGFGLLYLLFQSITLLALEDFGLVGGFVGAKLNLMVSEWYLQVTLLILIPALALFTILKPDVGAEDRSNDNSRQKIILLSIIIGFVVGTYHAFYGPASGTFYMLAFATLVGYDLVTATGNTRFVTLFVSIVSSITYAMSGCVNWMYVLCAVPGYAIGNYVGASMAISKGAKFVRPMYYGIMALLFIKLVKDFFFGG